MAFNAIFNFNWSILPRKIIWSSTKTVLKKSLVIYFLFQKFQNLLLDGDRVPCGCILVLAVERWWDCSSWSCFSTVWSPRAGGLNLHPHRPNRHTQELCNRSSFWYEPGPKIITSEPADQSEIIFAVCLPKPFYAPILMSIQIREYDSDESFDQTQELV
jgi:hypothetical protein